MTSEHNNWQSLYSPAESRWQDLTRIGKFILPIVFILFFLAMYGVGYFFFYFDTFLPAQNQQAPEYYFFVRVAALVFPPIVVIIMGLSFISWQMKKFIIAFYQPKEDEKLKSLIRRKLLGIPPLPPLLGNFFSYPFVVLREPSSLADNHWARWFGGPATLVVYDGLAVYIERGNVFSRVVGPGLPFLERHERIREVVDLRPQNKTGTTNPWTKDGIHIHLTVRAEVQIHADQDAIKNSFRLRYPFDPIAVKRAVEYSSARLVDNKLVENSWLDGAWGAITGSVNKFVAGHSLDELFLAPEIENHPDPNDLDNQPMESIEQLLSSKISMDVTHEIQSNLQKYGINLLDLQIINVEVPEKVEELRTKYWESIKKKIAAKRDSRAEADRIRTREQAHADAQRTMLAAIINRLKVDIADPRKLTEHLIFSLSGILDQGLDDPIVRPLIAKEAFAVLERMKKLLEEGF